MAADDKSIDATYLAYTHNLTVETSYDDMEQSHARVIHACSAAQDFVCTVLASEINHSEYPSASARMRLAPSGITRLVDAASQSGRILHRSTSAQDLARPIRDSADEVSMLREYLSELKQLKAQSKNDIQGLIRITSEIASTITKLERALGEQARLTEQVELQVLSISFSVDRNSTFSSPIGEAISEFGEDLSEGVAQAITGIAYVFPWLVFLLPLLFFLRWLWRRPK